MRDSNLGNRPTRLFRLQGGWRKEQEMFSFTVRWRSRSTRTACHPRGTHGDREDREEIACSWTARARLACTSRDRSGGFRRPVLVAVETFHALAQRQKSETIVPAEQRGRWVNLPNWDGSAFRWGCPRCRRRSRRSSDA